MRNNLSLARLTVAESAVQLSIAISKFGVPSVKVSDSRLSFYLQSFAKSFGYSAIRLERLSLTKFLDHPIHISEDLYLTKVFTSTASFGAPSSLAINNCRFVECSSSIAGGAFFANSSSTTVSVTHSSFEHCTSSGTCIVGTDRGSITVGGIASYSGGFTMMHCCFETCSSSYAGAIYTQVPSNSNSNEFNETHFDGCSNFVFFSDFGSTRVRRTNFSNGISSSHGLHFGCNPDYGTITYTTFFGNTAGYAIFSPSTSTITRTSDYSNFVNNTASTTYGIIYNWGYSFVFNYFVFSKNSNYYIIGVVNSGYNLVLENCISDSPISGNINSTQNCNYSVSSPSLNSASPSFNCYSISNHFTESSNDELSKFTKASIIISSFAICLN